MNELVSIIVPVYNGEKYLRKSLESIILQTYKNIEIIVIDDGSTDRTESIVKSFKDIKYIRIENSGPSRARNVGIEISKGQYIAFQDCDDISDHNRIEEQLIYMKEKKADVVYTKISVIDENSCFINHLNGIEIEKKEDFLAMSLFRQLIPCPSNIFVKRMCFEKIRYPEDVVHAEDYRLIISLAEQYKFAYLNRTLYYYRRHDGNLTNNHKVQLESEVKYIKLLGDEYIYKCINKTSYSESTKRMLLGKIYIKIHKYKDALIHFNNIDNGKSKDPNLYFYRGICYFNNKEYADAIIDFNKAIDLDNKKAEALNNLGCCYAIINQKEYAYRCFEEALSLRHNYIDPQKNIIALKQKKYIYYMTNIELRKELMDYRG